MSEIEIHYADAEWLLSNRTCDLIVTDTPFGYTKEDKGRGFTREGTTDLLYYSFVDCILCLFKPNARDERTALAGTIDLHVVCRACPATYEC